MANGNLERRVTKLEQAGGGASDFDERLRKFCDTAGYEYEALKNAVKGHETELYLGKDGGITWEGFLVIVRCVCPEVMQSAR
jgi:hypothetical protein